MSERTWMYGLTADEWLHLACEDQLSEVAPCCADISQLREALQDLTTAQGENNPWAALFSRRVKEAYDIAASSHELEDPAGFPLLQKVMTGIRAAVKP